jgi:hypothetical protein
MAKQLVVFITSLTILISIVGCPPVKPEPVELPKEKVGTPEATPSQLETPEIEPLIIYQLGLV